MKRLSVPWLLIPLFLSPVTAWASGICSQQTNCLASGHFALTAIDYPYAEDITFHPTDTPVPSPQTLTGPATAFTEIQGGCVDISGNNLNGTQAFNALLRANVQVQSTTAAVGARYEVQLVVDGQEYGWYVRRLRGLYPQFDLFMATSQGPTAHGLSAGNHTFTVLARLIDSGTITLSNTWTAAFGSPTSNPSVASVASSQISLANIYYQPVTNQVSFTNSQPVDFVVEGYFQIDSGTAGQTINLAPFLDGVRQSPIATLGIPQHGYEGLNFLSLLPNVAAGTHTLEWRVVTNGYTTLFSNRSIEGVAFPVSAYEIFPQSTSTLTVTSSTMPPYLQDTGCGLYTLLLTGTFPVDNTGAFNQIYEGYVELTGASTGSGTYDHLSFESYFNSPPPGVPNIDGGARNFQQPGYHDGVYIVGDSGLWSEGTYTETVNLWGRRNNLACGGGSGTYDVGKRFFWVRHVPVTPSTYCYYQ